MRFGPGRVLLLLGAFFVGCSLFPDVAPVVSSTSNAGAGGAATGGADARPGGAGSGASGAAANGGADANATGGSSGGGGVQATGGAAVADAGDASASDAARPDSSADAAPRTVTYVATVADCLEAVTQPTPGSCLSYTASMDGPNELWVDMRRTGHRAFTTYLLFSVDGTIANHTVDDVELVVSVTSYTNAGGSGADVWEVVPFTAQTLYLQTPSQVGGKPLATSPGAVARGQTVTYSLPPIVTANQSFSLGLFTPGGDGTGYWGLNGNPTSEPPPVLKITYH